jgi:hypothetical protein
MQSENISDISDTSTLVDSIMDLEVIGGDICLIVEIIPPPSIDTS